MEDKKKPSERVNDLLDHCLAAYASELVEISKRLRMSSQVAAALGGDTIDPVSDQKRRSIIFRDLLAYKRINTTLALRALELTSRPGVDREDLKDLLAEAMSAPHTQKRLTPLEDDE